MVNQMKNKTKYRHSFKEVVINNRWKKPFHQRNSDWVIFGLSKQFFTTIDYEYKISLFGIDIRLWFERHKKLEQWNEQESQKR